jgi:hypothetical protein
MCLENQNYFLFFNIRSYCFHDQFCIYAYISSVDQLPYEVTLRQICSLAKMSSNLLFSLLWKHLYRADFISGEFTARK